MKLSTALYLKNCIKTVVSTGYSEINVPVTQSIIEAIFECMTKEGVDIKSKFYVFKAFESMLSLYIYQVTN